MTFLQKLRNIGRICRLKKIRRKFCAILEIFDKFAEIFSKGTKYFKLLGNFSKLHKNSENFKNFSERLLFSKKFSKCKNFHYIAITLSIFDPGHYDTSIFHQRFLVDSQSDPSFRLGGHLKIDKIAFDFPIEIVLSVKKFRIRKVVHD